MGFTRREFLKSLMYSGAAFAGAWAGYLSLSEVNKTRYVGNKTVNTTKTETTTVNSTTTVTETTTQTNSTTTQTPQNLEEILFGNNDIQFIPLEVKDVETDSNNAYLTVYNYLKNTQLKIGLPIQYVSNGNINIGNLLSGVNNYNQNNGLNYKVYFLLGRANVDQAVQQNGIWNLPAPQIYYNILISDRGWKDVYNALQNLWNGNATAVMPTSQQGPYSNSLWGWDNGSVIILYQNGQQVNSVTDYINLADSILGTPNNPNPSSQGILHVDTIASIQESGVYQNQYPVYGVNNYYITGIVLTTKQGYPLFSNL